MFPDKNKREQAKRRIQHVTSRSSFRGNKPKPAASNKQDSTDELALLKVKMNEYFKKYNHTFDFSEHVSMFQTSSSAIVSVTLKFNLQRIIVLIVIYIYTNYLVKILMLHSLWLKMMFETSKHVPKIQKCGCIFFKY